MTANPLFITKSDFVQARITGVPGANQTYKFEQNQGTNNLYTRPIRLYSLEAITATQLAITPNGNYNIITAAAAANVVVTLVDNSSFEYVRNMPINSLVKQINGGIRSFFNGQIIDLNNCYITLVAAAGLNINDVVAFVIYYEFAK